MIPFSVTSFPDTSAVVIAGLKNRFTNLGGDFTSARISTLKNQTNTATYEVVVIATGGQETNNGTTKRVPLSILVFANDFGTANRLAEKTAEFLKSLPALGGRIKRIEISNSGEAIASPGTQECRNITGLALVGASKTTHY